MKCLPIVLTVEQLAEFLGQDQAELYRAIRDGAVPGVYRAGKRLYVGRDNFLKSITRAAPEPTKVGDPLGGVSRCADELDFELGDI
jgi:hypothetical protein